MVFGGVDEEALVVMAALSEKMTWWFVSLEGWWIFQAGLDVRMANLFISRNRSLHD